MDGQGANPAEMHYAAAGVSQPFKNRAAAPPAEISWPLARPRVPGSSSRLHSLLASTPPPITSLLLVKELRLSSITWPVANTAEHCSYTPSRFGSASPRIAWAGWLRVVSRWVEY